MTEFTVRLIIVVKAASRATADQLAAQPDTGNTSAGTFAAALARPATPSVPFAYWCSWQMTPTQAIALRLRMKTAGLEDTIVTAAEKATYQPKANAKAYVFDGRDGQWTPAEVLQALDLVLLASGAV